MRGALLLRFTLFHLGPRRCILRTTKPALMGTAMRHALMPKECEAAASRSLWRVQARQ